MTKAINFHNVKRYGTKITGNVHFKYVTAEMENGPWVKQEDYFALLTQFEAERQRADATFEYKTFYDEAMTASNEEGFACMSAAQVIKYQAEEITALKADIESYIHINGELATEVEALKAKLANPVVLSERWKPCDCIDCAYAYDSEATKKAIITAGFTVKGG